MQPTTRSKWDRPSSWRCALWALASLLVVVAAGRVMAAEPRSVDHRLGGDEFAAGPRVTVVEPVGGDLFAAGGTVDVRGHVGGDAVLAGGKVWVSGGVGQSLYAMGGQVTLLGQVAHNMRSVAGEVLLAEQGEVEGNVSVAGGQVTLRGPVRGQVQAGGGRVLIDGPVAGDVIVGAGTLELGPRARIGGQLRWRSGSDIVRDPAAEVQGGVQRIPLPALNRAGRHEGSGRDEAGGTRSFGQRAAARAGFTLLWTIGLALLAAALLAGLPRWYGALARTLRQRIGLSLLLGFVLLVCVPLAALLLLVTVIGIPVGLLALLAYALLLPLAYVSAAIAIGDWALQRWRPGAAARLRWRMGAAALALLLLAIVGALPWLGGWVGFLVMLAGLGALLLQAREQWWASRSAAVA